MKSILIALALTLTALFSARANVYTYDFSGVNTPIPDGNVSGITDTRTLPGMTGIPSPEINNVTVSLNISGGYNGDLYAYLVHNGTLVVLLNRVGTTATDGFGYDNAGLAITINDSAGTDVHVYQNVLHEMNGSGQVTGDWQPDGRTADPSAVMDTSARSTSLGSFNGLDPNGSWTLFFADTVDGEQSTLSGWQLEVSTVPEPTGWALLIFALIAALAKIIQLSLRQRIRI